MEKKGNEFKGLAGGRNYKHLARLFGFTEKFYRKGVGNVRLANGMKALDLGCGPGALSFALAEKASPQAEIIGIDISEDQLNYARSKCFRYSCNLKFENCSMSELPYPDEYFDVVVTSMALHETPPKVRRAAIAQTARTLKKNGCFILVDWSKPKFGLWGILWFPMICWGAQNKDNWENVYPELCRQNGLQSKEDCYINSIARRQVFVKE
ncbi:MAG: class I SAM-dependent methyltransferase [Dysgonamonadaceae bacterium]|jgi:demethylmenaquinone methyltransferase/2-methoxy-6-polyprenyl-1,4-benzoquinol methylase|nr:class I SAM-dependent methyltransferase [Dysgonamonadaceae bacterium]